MYVQDLSLYSIFNNGNCEIDACNICYGLSWWLVGKGSVFNAGDPGSIPDTGRSPGEGNGYPLQYSCLENSTDRGAWWATVHGVAKSPTQLSN